MRRRLTALWSFLLLPWLFSIALDARTGFMRDRYGTSTPLLVGTYPTIRFCPDASVRHLMWSKSRRWCTTQTKIDPHRRIWFIRNPKALRKRDPALKSWDVIRRHIFNPFRIWIDCNLFLYVYRHVTIIHYLYTTIKLRYVMFNSWNICRFDFQRAGGKNHREVINQSGVFESGSFKFSIITYSLEIFFVIRSRTAETFW